jgi:hypothetical protein
MAKKANAEATRTYGTAAEALANKPTDGKERRLYSVASPDGRVVFTWAAGNGSAIIQAARGLGFETAVHAKAASKEKVAGMIAQLSPEDRAALLEQLGNGAPAGAVAPAADKAPERPAGLAPEKPAEKVPGKKGGK